MQNVWKKQANMSPLIVSELSVYPVKSCAGISQKLSKVEAFGLSHDRRWMIVDGKGVMLTQRKLAKMCLIKTELVDDVLYLKHFAMDDFKVVQPVSANKVKVKVWYDECIACDAGDHAANWLSQILGVTCRLVYFPENEIRQVDLKYANQGDKTAFSDGFPLLLISQASLDDLNARLQQPISMQRFRPNLVVQGCAPFAEDSWKKIRIGSTVFRIVKPCSRCVIPSINIETGERETEPTKTLLGYRRRENKIYFGQNVIAEIDQTASSEIKVGMTVEIIE